MRKPRMKPVGKPTYFHLFNKALGPEGDFPFDDVTKNHAMKLLVELSDYFLVEPISATILSNHFHVVVYAPAEAPNAEEAAHRHNTWHGLESAHDIPRGKTFLDPKLTPDKCADVAAQMIDVSCFMKLFQQKFTIWRNHIYKRQGSSWVGRFKSTIVEGSREALWNCVKYVELNPVRAGLVEDPADYRFCSWGRFSGTGRHPFAASFVKHMRAVAEVHATVTCDQSLSDEEIFAEFRGELARLMAADRGESSEEIFEAAETARTQGDSMKVRFLRRTRHWTDGGIIGTKTFVLETGCQFEDRARMLKKQFSRGVAPGGVLYCFRRLRMALE